MAKPPGTAKRLKITVGLFVDNRPHLLTETEMMPSGTLWAHWQPSQIGITNVIYWKQTTVNVTRSTELRLMML